VNLKNYYDRLQRHDWYHEFSDDHRYYSSGRKDRQELMAISEQSPEHKALYLAFYDHMFSGPPWNTEKKPLPKKPEYEEL